MLERRSYVVNYFLADMFINILGLIKVLPLDFLISDHTRSEISIFFFPKWTVSTVKGSIFTTIVRRQGGQLLRFVIKEFLGSLKTFQTQDIAFNMWKIVKKKIKMLHCCPKSEKCSISAQKSRKCSRELEM